MRIYIFLLAILTFVVLSHAERIPRTDAYRGYSGDVQLQLDVKLSSANMDVPYFVGKDTVCVNIPESHRNVLICSMKSNTKDIWYGFEQNITTMTITPGKATPGKTAYPLEPGDYLNLHNFMGNIYFLNDDLSQSSSCVVVQRFIMDSDFR